MSVWTGRTHWVYEAFDGDGLLLYIGRTGRPNQRYREHMAGQYYACGWFDPFVTDWRWHGPYTFETAKRIEKAWIAERAPIWNSKHHGPNGRDKTSIERYLRSRNAQFRPHPTRNGAVVVP